MKYRANVNITLGKEIIIDIPDKYDVSDNNVEELVMQLYDDGIFDVDVDIDNIETNIEVMQEDNNFVDKYTETIDSNDVERTIIYLGWDEN